MTMYDGRVGLQADNDGKEVLPEFERVTLTDLLLTNNRLLADLLAVQMDIRAAVSGGGERRSSVELKVASARSDPDPCVKIYAGSPATGLVEEALDAFGRLKRGYQERQLNHWQETVDALAEAKAA